MFVTVQVVLRVPHKQADVCCTYALLSFIDKQPTVLVQSVLPCCTEETDTSLHNTKIPSKVLLNSKTHYCVISTAWPPGMIQS